MNFFREELKNMNKFKIGDIIKFPETRRFEHYCIPTNFICEGFEQMLGFQDGSIMLGGTYKKEFAKIIAVGTDKLKGIYLVEHKDQNDKTLKLAWKEKYLILVKTDKEQGFWA